MDSQLTHSLQKLQQRAMWRNLAVVVGDGRQLISPEQLPTLTVPGGGSVALTNESTAVGSASLLLTDSAAPAFVMKVLVSSHEAETIRAVGAGVVVEQPLPLGPPRETLRRLAGPTSVSPIRFASHRPPSAAASRLAQHESLPRRPEEDVSTRGSLFTTMAVISHALRAARVADAMNVVQLGRVTSPSDAIPRSVGQHLHSGRPWQGVGAILERCETKGRPNSRVVRPFSDAEVFQLFYLQLVWRAFLDVVVLDMEARDHTGSAHLRAERLGIRIDRHSSLTFSFDGGDCVVFPPGSPTMFLTHLTSVAHPFLAGAQAAPDVQRLWGATCTIPFVGPLGSAIQS